MPQKGTMKKPTVKQSNLTTERSRWGPTESNHKNWQTMWSLVWAQNNYPGRWIIRKLAPFSVADEVANYS